ncbi:MAG: type II secretion system F family protein, partial [Saprospiraceae bacterium]|nr:type II secretion system F family protein [Saprospiraceae bacterium]MCB0684109.1 type II secretion system F family protein [Saprospiraceae bacterium]
MRRKEAMYGELEILLKAGLDLKTCLDLWRDNQDRESDRQLAQQVVGDVVAGHSLSAALRKSGRFSSFEIFSVQIAESSGQLPEIAAELRSHFGLLMHYRK